MKRILGIALGIVYLLCSSVIFHSYSMDIVDVFDQQADCGHHQMNSASPVDTSCYESCLGSYDDLSSCIVEEKKYTYHMFELAKEIVFNADLFALVFSPAVYDIILDGGGGDFSETYIKITKKLE